jgi:hypothetical protein
MTASSHRCPHSMRGPFWLWSSLCIFSSCKWLRDKKQYLHINASLAATPADVQPAELPRCGRPPNASKPVCQQNQRQPPLPTAEHSLAFKHRRRVSFACPVVASTRRHSHHRTTLLAAPHAPSRGLPTILAKTEKSIKSNLTELQKLEYRDARVKITRENTLSKNCEKTK